MEQPAPHPPSTTITTTLEYVSPLPCRSSPTSVTETLSSADESGKSTEAVKEDVLTWENPRWKYFQEKRLRLSQQRVRLEQRLFEYADNDVDNDNALTPGKRSQSQKLATSTKLQGGSGSARKDVVFRTAKVLRKSKSCPADNSKQSHNRVSQEIPTDPTTSAPTNNTSNNNTSTSTRTVIWSGPLEEQTGQPHGRGRMVFPNGQEYKGQVAAGLRHGVGCNQWPNGQCYRGEWLAGSRTGRGTHVWPDGRKVTGQWLDGHLHGRVFYTWPDDATYDGDCWMGKKHGRGTSTSASASVYQGQYSEGFEDGFGTLTDSDASGKDSSKYRGQFRQGQRHGYGIQIWQHKTYDGEWKCNAMEGRGKLSWHSGAVYTGQVRQNRYHGNGSYMDTAGNKFVGHWEHGAKHGHGAQSWKDGSKYSGSFRHGRRHGYGRMSHGDGSMYCGGWKDGQRHGRGIQVSSHSQILHCGLWTNDQPVYKKAPDSWHDDLDVASSSPSQSIKKAPDAWLDDLDVTSRTSRTTRSDEDQEDDDADDDKDRDETLDYSVDSPLMDHDTFVWESP